MNPFEQLTLSAADSKKAFDQKPDKNPFDELKVEEGWGKSLVRYLAQIPSGIAKVRTWPLELMKLIGTGDAFDPEEVDRVRDISEREGIPFDEEKYFKAAEAATDYFPTVGNAQRIVEEKTGLPLQARTRGQKFVEFASGAGKISSQASKAANGPATLRGLKTGLPNPVVGAGIATGKEALVEVGVPEPIADVGSFALLKTLPKGSPNINIGKEKKPSGLITRRYESLENPTEVSASRHGKITQAVEKDFKAIKDEIIKDSPVERTYNAMKEDRNFKGKIGEQFKRVEELAETIPETYSSSELKGALREKTLEKGIEGTTANDYDKNYRKFMEKFSANTTNKNINNAQLVKQYRKNNADFGDYNPNRSKSWNRARKDALLDVNQVIGEMIENKNPDSEFGKLFKFTNKRWKEIHESEFIDKFIDDMFKGKVNFEKGQKFNNKDFQKTFKKALGDNYPKFETLMKDLMSTEKANSLLKVAKGKGFTDLASKAGLYLVEPNLVFLKYGHDAANYLYKSILDKPKLTITWDEGIKAMERGDFAKAEKAFSTLQKELKMPVIEK
jgi:hypothetical protein